MKKRNLNRGYSLIRKRDSLGPYSRTMPQEGRYKATWKRKFKLPWRKAGLLILMIQWTRTRRLSIKIYFSRVGIFLRAKYPCSEKEKPAL